MQSSRLKINDIELVEDDSLGPPLKRTPLEERTTMPAWLPLESNPEVLNPFVWRLGVPAEWGFSDVFGLDPELLMMIPRPCLALCLLFPMEKIAKPRREKLKAARAEAEAAKKADPAGWRDRAQAEQGLFFMEQVQGAGNACGTVATIHAAANAMAAGALNIDVKTPLGRFIAEACVLPTSTARGRELVAADYLHELSDETARSGATDGAGTHDHGDRHFVCFCERGGRLFELDGRNLDEAGAAFPVDHGPTTPETFVDDAAKVIRDEFIALDAENPLFNVVAFGSMAA
mmetsp:Transcript_36648/g.113414  ORF Transcript_36648/g.113414 Transcript_36648/m.113414 type:complete len:289 (+) Transcript_36648:2806-3672(+)